MEHVFNFPHIGNVIIPTDEFLFFRGVGLNHQPDNSGIFLPQIWNFNGQIPLKKGQVLELPHGPGGGEAEASRGHSAGLVLNWDKPHSDLGKCAEIPAFAGQNLNFMVC